MKIIISTLAMLVALNASAVFNNFWTTNRDGFITEYGAAQLGVGTNGIVGGGGLDQSWFTLLGTNANIAKANVSGFVAELTKDGLLGSLADAAFMQTNFGAVSNQVVTLRGVTNSAATQLTNFNSFGALFSGVASMDWPVTVSATNTLIVICRLGTATNYTADSIVGGLYNGTNYSQEIYYHGDWMSVIMQNSGTYTAGTATSPSSGGYPPVVYDWLSGPDNPQYYINSYNRRTLGWSWSNNVVVTFDGVTEATNAYQPTVTNYTDLHLGGRLAASGNILPYQYEIQGWVLFNGALSQSQLQLADRAIRWLDISPVNYVFDGDSLSTPLYAGVWTTGWEEDYMRQNHPNIDTIYYDGAPSTSTVNATNQQRVQYTITDRAPYGNVTQTIDSIWYGINDLSSYASAANLTNLWLQAKTAGDTVWVWSIYNAATNSGYSAYYSTAHGQVVTNVNQLIGSSPTLYDHWFAIDAWMGGPINGPWSNTNNVTQYTGSGGTDGLHWSDFGNQQIANFVAAYTPSPVCDTNGIEIQYNESTMVGQPTNSQGNFQGAFTGNASGLTNFYYPSNSWPANLAAITNGMKTGGFKFGNSNGWPVLVWYSNSVLQIELKP